MPKITGGLHVEPELGALFEEFPEFERHFRRDATAVEQNFTGSEFAHGTSLSSGKRRVELGEQCQALFRRTTRCHSAEAGFGAGSANVLVGRSVRRCRRGRRRSGTGPRPFLGALAQAGLDGVLVDVEHDILEMCVVADKTVPVFAHPKVLWVRDANLELLVVGQCPSRGDGLPTLDDLC